MIIALIIIPTTIYGQKFPLPEYPYTLVNDYSKILKIDEFDFLEIKLEELFDESSVRIMVIIVDDLNGMDISGYSLGITDEWNVSLKTTPKMILVMVKPKMARSKAEVLITAGNDMKELIPDHVAGMIIENEILPQFRKKKYYDGLFSATDVIASMAKGEITWKEYVDSNKGSFGKTVKEYALNVALVLMIIFLTGRVLLKYRGKTGVGSRKF
jgi:uncharacterized protein